MKRKPRWTLEMLTASLAVLCGLLLLVLLVQRPTAWPLLAVLVVLWGIGATLFRCKLRSWVVRWTSGTTFEKSKVQFSLEPLSQPAALLSGETVLWYNSQFRTRLLGGQDVLASRVQKLLPGLDLQLCRKREGQLLTLADGYWSVHSSTVPGEAESVTLLVLNEETELRRIEAEYKASRPGYLAFQLDGYDDVFGDLMDSERARLLEGVNRILEDMIGRGSGFLRRVGSGGRYIAVVEERQLEQFANRGYDVLDKIRALDPSVSLSMSIGIGRGARTLREAQDMAEHALDMAQGRGGDQAAEMTLDGFTFYGGVSHGVEKRSKVRSRLVADQLVKLIKEADHVVIMGHRMSDLDAIGAAEGVLRICKICDVPAVIAVRRDATLAASLIDALCKAGQKDDFIDPKDALPIISKRTLCIVVDTYQAGLVESKDILEKCGKVAVIDHHRKGVGYIENPALVCHEPYSSSASELVTELLQYVGERDDKPNRVEAEGLLAGILLDTQDFTLHTGVRTFEAAAALRRYGAETERGGRPGSPGRHCAGRQRPIAHSGRGRQLCGSAGGQRRKRLCPQHGCRECAGDHGVAGRRRPSDHGSSSAEAYHPAGGTQPHSGCHRPILSLPEKDYAGSTTGKRGIKHETVRLSHRWCRSVRCRVCPRGQKGRQKVSGH